MCAANKAFPHFFILSMDSGFGGLPSWCTIILQALTPLIPLFPPELGTISGPPLFGFVVDVSHSYQIGWLFLAAVGTIGTMAALQSARMEKGTPLN